MSNSKNLLAQEQKLLFRLTGESAFLDADQFYFADLSPVNGSGVEGVAVFAYDEETNSLTVLVTANGLEPDRPHAQHIHGFADGREASDPTPEFDTDGDGYIELPEGGSAWGPVLFGMPTQTTATGEQFLVETFQLPDGSLVAGELLALRNYNIHGLSVPAGAGAGTAGEVNGSGGYIAPLVVADGEIQPVTSLGQLNGLLGRVGAHRMSHEDWVVG